MRLEPFATLAVSLQQGHFDLADRLFHSIEVAWDITNTVMANNQVLLSSFWLGLGFFFFSPPLKFT